MPIHEYQCENCLYVTEHYFHTTDKIPRVTKCDFCGKKSKKVLSAFNTGQSILKKVSGIDDTDDLTLGKIIDEGKIPEEYARPVRERISKFNKGQEEHKRRQHQHKFSEKGDPTDPKGGNS